MQPSLAAEYRAKLRTPQEAVRCVKSGDTVYIGCCSSVAYALCEALGARGGELEDVTLVSSMVGRPTSVFSGEHPRAFRACSFFMGPGERQMYRQGLGEFTSVHLSQIDLFFRDTARPDVAFFEVSPPDEEGYMSYGATGVALNRYAREGAKTVVLQINRNVPRVFGEDHRIHLSQADFLVEADDELTENVDLPPDDAVRAISDYLVEQIPDGACLQLGLGGLSGAVGFGLRGKNDLGIHTELMTNSLMELMKAGVVTNRRKSFLPGRSVASFTFGSKELYHFIDNNPDMYYAPFPVVNNPVNIAKNDSMISVNTAISIDLLGQVCADSIGWRQHSATGGQVDFVRGAQMSRGGKSFLAVQSTVDNPKLGRRSRIVSQLPPGAAVTTPRSDVQYVVTEYGCVNLKGLTMRGRVHAMIDLAHPDFRPQLTEEAKRAGIY